MNKPIVLGAAICAAVVAAQAAQSATSEALIRQGDIGIVLYGGKLSTSIPWSHQMEGYPNANATLRDALVLYTSNYSVGSQYEVGVYEVNGPDTWEVYYYDIYLDLSGNWQWLMPAAPAYDDRGVTEQFQIDGVDSWPTNVAYTGRIIRGRGWSDVVTQTATLHRLTKVGAFVYNAGSCDSITTLPSQRTISSVKYAWSPGNWSDLSSSAGFTWNHTNSAGCPSGTRYGHYSGTIANGNSGQIWISTSP